MPNTHSHSSRAAIVSCPGRARPGFTLIELLIVIAIISILAGMTLTIMATIRFRASTLDTVTRMQAVLNGLATYSQTEGATAASLQMNFQLGGVGKFASLDTISGIIDSNASLNAGTVMPPLLVVPDFSGTVWSTTAPDQKDQQKPQWKNTFDVLPSAQNPAASAAYYATRWPTQWPTTDWLQASPGTLPPILRFPWGKPGLTLSGEICDPNQPAAAVVRHAMEFDSLYNWRKNQGGIDVPVANAWITMGGVGSLPTGPTPVLKFSTANSAQSDAVVSSVEGRRSDGTDVTVQANQPLPFDLGYLSPLRTIDLLVAAGVLPVGGESQYRTDRKLKRTWNDAWGNPLVVGYAVFQPERFYRNYDRDNRRELLLKSAQNAYGYGRSIYVAVGAVGPERGAIAGSITGSGALDASTGPASDPAPLAQIWKQICRNCGAHLWTESGFASPPKAWSSGTAKGAKNGMRSFLSQPKEIR